VTLQSGIVATFGGSARITENVVSGNVCAMAFCGPDYLNQVQSFGIVLGEAAPGTVVAENTVFGNDVGIDVEYSDASVAIRENRLTNNRYFGITLLDGTYTLTENGIRGGMVGVVVAALTMDTVAVLYENRIADVSAAPVLELPSWGFTATAIVREE
jgi:parallel beta-helix repeat protein